jgi:hypothetical protein
VLIVGPRWARCKTVAPRYGCLGTVLRFAHYVLNNPFSRAITTACVLLVASSFRMMLRTWNFTVL